MKTAANDNQTTAAAILANLSGLLDGTTARWALDGWIHRLAATRHPVHAVNSFVKHEHEFGAEGNILWAAAFVATCAHCAAHGVSAPEAAALINARRAARSGRVAA